MKQETLFSMFCGALVTVAAYGVYKAGRWSTVAVGDLSKGLVGIGVMAEQNEKLADNAALVAAELALLRSVITNSNQIAQTPESNLDANPGGDLGPADPAQNLKPFPPRPPGMYRTVVDPAPDAKVEDSTVDDTDDEQMVKYEKLEQLRQNAGHETDDDPLLDAELLGNV